jgi:hypothetical protein
MQLVLLRTEVTHIHDHQGFTSKNERKHVGYSVAANFRFRFTIYNNGHDRLTVEREIYLQDCNY